MSSLGLCLSTATILRCESFTTFQSRLLIIPTALELVFSTALIFTNWDSGRRFWLITVEGWIYFSLALLELLSHILPAVRESLGIFQVVDIFLAATSFLPLLLFSLFLFLFARADLIGTLPSRLRSTTLVLLTVFIPAILASNEVASFIGISRRNLNFNGRTVIGIGFSTPTDQSLWSFFTSLALAVLTAYQEIHFGLAFFRTVKAFLAKRRLESTSPDSAHMFKGIIWHTGAIKLAIIETVVGFAQVGFGGALTRRILRLLSRAFLCIGIVKGIDGPVDFGERNDEITDRRPFRRSQLKQLVSNPRLSTFQQLSPTATAFHATPRAPGGATAKGGLAGMNQFASMRDAPNQRVTVHFGAGAPTLHMRFSLLDLPSPSLIVDRAPSRRASSYYPSSAIKHDSPEVRARTPIYARHTRAYSDFSLRGQDSMYSVNAVRELSARFPGLPPRVTQITQPANDGVSWEDPYTSYSTNLRRGSSTTSRMTTRSSNTPSRSNSLSRRKPVPRTEDINPGTFINQADAKLSDLHTSFPRSVGEDESSAHVAHESDAEAAYKIGLSPSTNFSSPITSASGYTQPITNSSSALTTPDNDNPFVYDDVSVVKSARSSDLVAEVVREHSVVDIPLRSADLDATLAKLKETVPRARIKNMGKAPQRFTPAPIKTSGFTRGSVYIEPIMIPPRQPGIPAIHIIQEESVGSNYSSALRDSEVLGQEDTLFVRSI